MPVRVVLGVRDEWDSVHLLSGPGALAPSLCGFEPSLPWRRVWIDFVDDLGRVTGCNQCQAVYVARQVSAPQLRDGPARTFSPPVL